LQCGATGGRAARADPTSTAVVTLNTAALAAKAAAAVKAAKAKVVAAKAAAAKVAAAKARAAKAAAAKAAAEQAEAEQATEVAQPTNTVEQEPAVPPPTNTVEREGLPIYDHDAEISRVKQLLGLDREPTSGEMQLVAGCDQGYIDPATCSNAGL